MIYKSESIDCPTGETHLVVTKLLEKYQPQVMVSSIEMQQELAQLKMKQSKNPSRFLKNYVALKISTGRTCPMIRR